MVVFLPGANFTPQRDLKSKHFGSLFAVLFLKVWHLMVMFLVSFSSSPRFQNERSARFVAEVRISHFIELKYFISHPSEHFQPNFESLLVVVLIL